MIGGFDPLIIKSTLYIKYRSLYYLDNLSPILQRAQIFILIFKSYFLPLLISIQFVISGEIWPSILKRNRKMIAGFFIFQDDVMGYCGCYGYLCG